MNARKIELYGFNSRYLFKESISLTSLEPKFPGNWGCFKVEPADVSKSLWCRSTCLYIPKVPFTLPLFWEILWSPVNRLSSPAHSRGQQVITCIFFTIFLRMQSVCVQKTRSVYFSMRKRTQTIWYPCYLCFNGSFKIYIYQRS